jgi:serine protease Do
MNDLVDRLNRELADVTEQVKSSLVQISNNHQGMGAGIIVADDGLILTNAHVVRKRSLQVELPDHQRLPASLLMHDRERDLALLKVEAGGLTAILLGDEAQPHAGQLVLALGHPWGIPGVVTSGIIIGGGTSLPGMEQEWLAVNLRVRPGNSGGPLVDGHGRLLGMNTVMAGSEVGLAIPVGIIRRFLDDFYHGEARSDADTPVEGAPRIVVV